ncbi:hypothetical protein SELMODRAFT_430166 [Selaginella moellendorffii]|uniref:Uncharacterized protein n=1 Tax=Selaginella moellendorffii TaxID=88036 RepID=D8T8J8_SELML|nr:hypothetical protein SELMODRAFT_430166 [Selaginella moellendorffii]
MGAVLLATLEQFTTNLGKLTFLWATVVLLGGFVTDMERYDFYFITVLLVSYGIRSFRFLNLTKGFKKPKVISLIQQLFIVLFVLTTIVLVILLDVGLTIFVLLLLVLSLLAFGYSVGSERSFVIIYNTALYNAEIFLALLNLGASIHWLRPPHYKYPKSNEFVAMICFFSIVIAESSLFLCNRSCWQIISVRYKLRKKNRDRPRFLLETKSKFFVAVYETTLRDGAIKGLRMNLVDYVANEFLESRGNRELRKSLLMLDAVSHWEEEDQIKRSGKLLLGSKREVVERLFECMGHKYDLMYRRAVISLVAEICKDENAFFAVAHVVQASDTGISLLVKALEPDTNKSVLLLLGKLAAFREIANPVPSVIPDFDFAQEDTHKKWKDSLRYSFNGDGDDPVRVDVEAEIQSSRQKIAKNLRTLLRKNQDLTRYLANALFCSSQDLQDLALDALAALVAYDPSNGDLLPGYKSVIYGLFQLVRACEADLRGSKSAVVLDLLCRKNRQYLETLLDGSGSSDDVIAVLMNALSFGLDHYDAERSKHTMSILCGLHDQKLLSEEQEKALDIAKIVDMVTTMTSSRPSGHGLTRES